VRFFKGAVIDDRQLSLLASQTAGAAARLASSERTRTGFRGDLAVLRQSQRDRFFIPSRGERTSQTPTWRHANFPCAPGFPEDAATGVAAGALGVYLTLHDGKCGDGVHKLRVAQGYAMGAPSLIKAITECDKQEITRVAIQGIATEIAQERIDIRTIPEQTAE
jgi:predicted PhzF superfamily epimerase YddE/YHI9